MKLSHAHEIINYAFNGERSVKVGDEISKILLSYDESDPSVIHALACVLTSRLLTIRRGDRELADALALHLHSLIQVTTYDLPPETSSEDAK